MKAIRTAIGGRPTGTWCKALFGALVLAVLLAPGPAARAQDSVVTALVLVNDANPEGYNPAAETPGEFQRSAERYLEHLQIPYEVVKVNTQAPPANITVRHVIIAGHRGLSPTAQWQTAITTAVANGAGFVNLDSASTVGLQSHIQNIFGASGSSVGTPGTEIRVPQAVLPGGSSPHFIAALQRRFRNDPPGDVVYAFHEDAGGVVRPPVQSTLLTGASGTVIATVGSDPLILARSAGAGRAVHFGTLDYLRADRFGFLMGVDDLFWRSVVWAARKPFVVRGYPRLWAVQMDDTLLGWGARVRDLYDVALTGPVAADGTGGPWRVTGYVFTDNLAPGSPDRASVVADINAGLLQVSPHARAGGDGDLYWERQGQVLTDATWSLNVNDIQAWKLGNGGADTIPSTSRSMVPHYWNLQNFTGYDLWTTLGVRYITEIQRPGVAFNQKTDGDRLRLRPFRLYELPPLTWPDENYPIYVADDYVVGSRAGLPAQTFFTFATQVIDLTRFNRTDLAWPGSTSFWPKDQPRDPATTADTIDQFQRYSWRLWTSLAPVQIYTHDSGNYGRSQVPERQQVIRDTSTWLNTQRVRHVFMEALGDYMRARTRSVLDDARISNGTLTLTFSGNATTADGDLIGTEFLLFEGDAEGTPRAVAGFTGGATVTTPFSTSNPSPTTTALSPASASAGTAGFTLTVSGTNFVFGSVVRWNGAERPTTYSGSATELTAEIPATDIAATGTAVVTVFTPAPGGGTSNPQTFTIQAAPVSWSDDFNRPDSPTLGSGWVQKSSAFSLAGNQVIKAPTSVGYPDNLVYRPAGENVLDAEASVEVRFSSLPPGYAQVFVRGQTDTIAQAGVFSGYLLFFDNDPGRAFLARIEGGPAGYVPLAQIAIDPVVNTTDTFRLRLRALGTNPVALDAFVERFTGTDWVVIGQAAFDDAAATRFATAGTVGFTGYIEGGVYTYDNFTRTEF